MSYILYTHTHTHTHTHIYVPIQGCTNMYQNEMVVKTQYWC